MKKISVFIAWIAILGIGLYLQPGQAKYHVIIDTDCGFDDLRAILMFLADHEFEVLAITTSEGSLAPSDGLIKVRSLLKTLHHEGIPTAAGRSLDIQPPSWRSFCQNIRWGEEDRSPPANSMSAIDLLSSAFENEGEKIRLVCLGSLTTASDFYSQHPEMKSKIERVVWYNDDVGASKGFNYTVNEKAAEQIFKSGIKIEIIKAQDQSPLGFDSGFLRKLAKVKTPYARLLSKSFESKEIQGKKAVSHLILRDDLAPLFILSPEIFISEQKANISLNALKDESAKTTALEMIIKILSLQMDTECQAFANFPDAPAFFAPDIRPYIFEIIERHGESEWRAAVLTNELHGHLGIYSLIGVKMGIRAREYFNIGVDDMAVLSFAGRKPPLSCLNDGLQVGTGATLGHGLITVSDDPQSKPEAIFAFRNRRIRISLKKETAEMVKAAISKAIDLYGNLTEPYWDDIRKQAIQFWLKLDRHKIFVIENIER
jgi:pyrimidine-specific ribonucleoside hydrolase